MCAPAGSCPAPSTLAARPSVWSRNKAMRCRIPSLLSGPACGGTCSHVLSVAIRTEIPIFSFHRVTDGTAFCKADQCCGSSLAQPGFFLASCTYICQLPEV